jgi:drug/metabolite transporter (DMT)-like permease
VETSVAALRAGRRHAILCILGSAVCFAVAAAFVKAVAPAIPTWEIVFFRSTLTLPVLLPLIRRAGGWRALRTARPLGHAIRTVTGMTGMYTSFAGYAVLPLATVTALGFSMPLFMTLLAVPLLGERLGWRRTAAALVGLLGVLIMIRPWQDGAVPLGPALMVMFGVLGWTLAMITIRRMGAAGEPNVTIVAWFSIGTALVSLVMMLPVWVTPDPRQFAFLVATGIMSAFAQLLMTEAYRVGEPTLVAPFEYSAIIYTTAIGFLIWSETPDGWDALGVGVLVASGLYIWHREVTLGLRR